MSDVKKIQCDLQEKPWNDYSSDEIRRYCLRNMSKFDCSFVVVDDQKEKTVYESFKWILWEMSPVLKEIMNDKGNQEKECKEIVLSNPKYIEAIVFYGHFKVVDTDDINLVDFYGASKQYEVKILEDEVIKMFDSEENQKNADWVKLFWLSYVKNPEDQQMRAVFEKVIEHVTEDDKISEANIAFILDFDEEFFDIFFDIMLSRWNNYECFILTEDYFIKHFFGGNKNKKLEEIGFFRRNYVRRCINKMDFTRFLCWEDYKIGPLVSNLLTTKLKIKNLETFESRCVSHERNHKDEIQSYIQKLRKGESILKTEK